MSPKVKRNLGIVMAVFDAIFILAFTVLTFSEPSEFILITLLNLMFMFDLYISIDYIKEQNQKIKIQRDLTIENNYMNLDRQKWDARTQRAATTAQRQQKRRPIKDDTTTPFEEEELVDLLQKQSEDLQQELKGEK